MHWDGTPGWLVGQIWTRSYVFLSLQLDSGPNWEHSNTNPITHQHTQSEISSFRIKVDFFSGFPGMEPASRLTTVDDGRDAVLWLRAIGGVCRMHGSSCRPDGRLSQVGAVLPLPMFHAHCMRTSSAIAGAPHRRRGDQHVGVDAAASRRGRGMCVDHAQHARRPCPCS